MRYIDADQMLEDFKRLHGTENELLNCYSADWIECFIEEYPTVELCIDTFRGTWEDCHSVLGWYRCSACYAVWDKPTRYCPCCGAKMRRRSEKT